MCVCVCVCVCRCSFLKSQLSLNKEQVDGMLSRQRQVVEQLEEMTRERDDLQERSVVWVIVFLFSSFIPLVESNTADYGARGRLLSTARGKATENESAVRPWY